MILLVKSSLIICLTASSICLSPAAASTPASSPLPPSLSFSILFILLFYNRLYMINNISLIFVFPIQSFQFITLIFLFPIQSFQIIFRFIHLIFDFIHLIFDFFFQSSRTSHEIDTNYLLKSSCSIWYAHTNPHVGFSIHPNYLRILILWLFENLFNQILILFFLNKILISIFFNSNSLTSWSDSLTIWKFFLVA